MPHAQPVPRSRKSAAVRGSRLKIATDVAGMLCPSEAPARPGCSFSLARVEINGAQRGTRARWGQWRKCLTMVIFRSGLIPRSTGLDPALSGIRRTISSSRSRRSGPVELQRGRERLVRRTQRQRNVISTSHRSDLGLRLTHLPFSQRPRGPHAAKLPECLRRLVAMRSAVPFSGQ
jgi:hypothetical protein